MEQKNYLYRSRKGPLAISMTNDYQFRALMQMNKNVLRALVGALLHLKEEEIVTVEIQNPIELGTYISVFLTSICFRNSRSSMHPI